jgi:hypothetical protein
MITNDIELQAAERELREIGQKKAHLEWLIKQYKYRRAGCNTTRTPIYSVVETTTTGDM